MNSTFKKFFLSVFFISFFSCSEELNFDQVDDLVISPVYNSSLTYFTVLPNRFFDDTGALIDNSITDSTVFRAFQNSFVRDNVVQIDLNVECKNEFVRDISIQIEFLDENNNLTYPPISFTIAAGVLDFTFQEILLISNNESVKNTLQVRITTEIDANGPPVNATDTDEFELQSAVTAYIESSI